MITAILIFCIGGVLGFGCACISGDTNDSLSYTVGYNDGLNDNEAYIKGFDDGYLARSSELINADREDVNDYLG